MGKWLRVNVSLAGGFDDDVVQFALSVSPGSYRPRSDAITGLPLGKAET